VRDKVGRDLDSGHRAFIDPDNRMIGMCLCEGLIKIIPTETAGPKEAFNVRLDELRPLDVKFLHGCARPTICVLYEDNRMCRHLKTYQVDVRERELTLLPWQQKNVDHGAKMLIAVPAPTNGVIVVGMSTVTYLNGHGGVQAVAIDATFFTAYGLIDSDGSRCLLGDQYGGLHVLVLLKQGSTVVNIAIDSLGTTSIPESICYLDNGVAYIGSLFGDSQLIKLKSEKEEDGSHVEVIQSYPNIGPILDMCVVESEKQGQSHIVTCSGAYKDGSLRLIRSGIGIHEQASVELPGIKGIWSLAAGEGSFDKYLVQAFIGETRIFGINDQELSEADIPGFSTEQTIFSSNVEGNLILQVSLF
jgi:DNA damage-binding protein 1